MRRSRDNKRQSRGNERRLEEQGAWVRDNREPAVPHGFAARLCHFVRLRSNIFNRQTTQANGRVF